MKRIALLMCWLVACAEPDTQVRITSALPAYGPLGGGSVISLEGTNFSASTRVVIAGHEAPLVRLIDTGTLEVVLPPGDRPGDAEVVVFDTTGSASARGIFRYSAPPTITQVSPAEVVFDAPSTTMTVTGTGFLDEGAGRVNVLVDGLLVGDVQVQSDTQLTFTAPPGRPLVRADVEVIDARGTATLRRAFRFRPSAHAGLLLFPAYKEAFADFYDPTDNSVISIPFVTPLSSRFTAVVRDESGDYWGVDRNRQFGLLDMTLTRFESSITVAPLLPTLVRVGGKYYGIDRIQRRIGELDPATGVFTPLSNVFPTCCGSYGLAGNDTTLWYTTRGHLNGVWSVTITQVDRLTGAFGTPVRVNGLPALHIEEMRLFQGKFYAVSRDGNLVTIDPTTGETAILPIPPERYKAMEIFE